MSAIEFINGVWPVVHWISSRLVIVLAKMHSDIEIKKNDLETIKEKIRSAF
jgi:hypothetical protein